jgi:ELWxxDGT repeat protein
MAMKTLPFAITFAVVATLVASIVPVGAATGPYLVKDINASGASNPQWMTPVNDTLFFSAKGPKGRELWKSDGTPTGTVRVKDIRRGANSSNPRDLVNVGGTLFFLANDGSHGIELWMSDGTGPGTKMVEDITLGAAGTPITSLNNAAGVLLFFISEVNDQELWTSDGTPEGTTMVAELTDEGGQPPQPLMTIFTTLYFQFSDGGVPQVWTSDGDPGNTGPVDYLPSITSALFGGWLIFLNGTYYFTHFDAASGIELWKSDGTPGGIELVKDINTSNDCGGPPTCSSEPTKPVILNGVMHFAAYNSDGTQTLWRSNGTDAGTYQISDVQFPWQLTKLGSRLIFAGQGPGDDAELWRTNGTTATLVKRLAPEGSFGSSPNNLIRIGNRVYFTADPLANPFHNPSDDELYRTDGTKAGTKRVMDINPNGASHPASLTNVGGTLYFTADDGAHGNELWRYVP